MSTTETIPSTPTPKPERSTSSRTGALRSAAITWVSGGMAPFDAE